MSAQYPPPAAPQPPPQHSGWRPTGRQIAGAVVLLIALIFIFQNTKTVRVRLIVPEVKAPLFVALLIAAVLGGLFTLLVQWRRSKRKGGGPPPAQGPQGR